MLRQALLCTAGLAVALALLPAHAGQRAFVSSTGNDANLAAGCTLASPCRTFQTAHTAVDAGGEIVALDAAGYAPVMITKSVSIIGNPGFVAGIAVTSGNGVTIATPGVNVVLRNLSINGIGGSFGIDMAAGNSLTVENCVISNMGIGLQVRTAARVRIVDAIMRSNSYGALIQGGASVDVTGSRFVGNVEVGFWLSAGTGVTTNAAVSDSVATGNYMGFVVGAEGTSGSARLALTRATAANNTTSGFHVQNYSAGGAALMVVGGSIASGNGTGFVNHTNGGSTLESLGDNTASHNTWGASFGQITAVPGL